MPRDPAGMRSRSRHRGAVTPALKAGFARRCEVTGSSTVRSFGSGRLPAVARSDAVVPLIVRNLFRCVWGGGGSAEESERRGRRGQSELHALLGCSGRIRGSSAPAARRLPSMRRRGRRRVQCCRRQSSGIALRRFTANEFQSSYATRTVDQPFKLTNFICFIC
jgi:hypothetical protein